jgi:hypothetical protein
MCPHHPRRNRSLATPLGQNPRSLTRAWISSAEPKSSTRLESLRRSGSGKRSWQNKTKSARHLPQVQKGEVRAVQRSSAGAFLHKHRMGKVALPTTHRITPCRMIYSRATSKFHNLCKLLILHPNQTLERFPGRERGHLLRQRARRAERSLMQSWGEAQKPSQYQRAIYL